MDRDGKGGTKKGRMVMTCYCRIEKMEEEGQLPNYTGREKERKMTGLISDFLAQFATFP